MTSFREEIIGDCRLILGDCREVLPTLGKVDAVVTDPPYGVDFSGKATKDTVRTDLYETYADTLENLRSIIVPCVITALGKANCGAIMCGNRRVFEYPPAIDIGGIYAPSGAGISPWGFVCFHTVLFYGRSPYMAAGYGSRPTATAIAHPGGHITGEAVIGHPCPKPISYMMWLVHTASLPGDTVLDIFCGSGTTGVACAKLGRKFIGVEIHEPYFDIACRRIEQAQRQGDLIRDVYERPAALGPML